MSMCPLCNGFDQVRYTCMKCGNEIQDMGRFIDYFDDYSAYMEIDLMKLLDGIETSLKDHKCAHLFYCPVCHSEDIKLIQE